MKQLLLLLLLLPSLAGTSQRPIVGDTIPDAPMRFLNSGGQLRLSHFRGKPLILNLWASWCGACLKALPTTDALHRQFADSLMILSISYETRGRVDSVLRKRPLLQQLTLPIVVEDTVLHTFFRPESLPHQVWVDRTGRILSITGDEYVTAANLRLLLAGKRLPFIQRIRDTTLNLSKPLFAVQAGEKGARFYSALGPHRPGITYGSRFVRDSASGTLRFYAVNFPIPHLYAMSHPQGALALNAKRSRYCVRDAFRYHYTPSYGYRDQWLADHTYSYEAVYPVGTPETVIMEGLKQDLDRFLGVTTSIDTVPTPCLVLERTGKGQSFATKGGPRTVELGGEYPVKRLQNARLSNLVAVLNNVAVLPPVVDETSYTGNVDLCLEVASLDNYQSLNPALAPYGLRLRPATRPLPVFTLQEAGLSKSSFSTFKNDCYDTTTAAF